MHWDDLSALIKKQQSLGHPVASVIARVTLDTNRYGRVLSVCVLCVLCVRVRRARVLCVRVRRARVLCVRVLSVCLVCAQCVRA